MGRAKQGAAKNLAKGKKNPKSPYDDAAPAPKRKKVEVTSADVQDNVESSKKTPGKPKTPVSIAVQKAIERHLGHLSEHELDCVQVNGMTCREYLTQGKERWVKDKSAVSYGKFYWANVNRMYSSAEGTRKLLQVSDKTLPVNEDLDKALDQARGATPNRKALMRWCDSPSNTLNQKECVGFLRYFLEVKVCSTGDQLECASAMLRFLHRSGLKTEFPGLFDVMSHHFDEVLEALWADHKKNGFDRQSFWQTWRSVASLVMTDVGPMDTLLAKKKEVPWASHLDELNQVSRTLVGASIFKFALYHVASAAIQKFCDDAVAGITIFTQQVVKDAKNRVHQKLDDLVGREALDAARNISLEYRGALVTVEVTSAVQEVNVRFDSLVKSVALARRSADDQGAPLLTPLWCELKLVPRTIDPRTVDAQLLSDANNARGQMNRSLVEASQHDGALIKDYFTEAKMAALKKMDPFIFLEKAWFDAWGTNRGLEELQKAVLDILPARADHPADASAAVKKLESLKQTPLYLYVPPSSKWAVNVPCEMVKAIANERRPAVDKLGDNIFYKDVVDRLAWFLRVEIPAGEDEDEEPAQVLRGDAAAKHLYEALDKKKTGFTLADVKQLCGFSFLLSAPQRQVLETWRSAAFKADCKAQAATSGSSAASSSASSASGAPTSKDAKASPTEKTSNTADLWD